MEMDFAPRLNLLTGDNGLGKTFLLDVAWWSLTRRWPHDINRKMTSGYAAKPRSPKAEASIEFSLTGKNNAKEIAYKSTYRPRDEAWVGKSGRPPNPGLVIYAHADSSFSVWDPARNYWKKQGNVDIQERLPGFIFSPQEVWDELVVDISGRPTVVCNGLIRDWASWIREDGVPAKVMRDLLKSLSTTQSVLDRITPGPLVRLPQPDARDIPSIKTPYADAVPILHASSGVRRIVALAYILLWSWNEHQLAAAQLGEEKTQQVVMIVDELESHLHPRWQRSILKSLLDLVPTLHLQATVQLITATHSPLVLASIEPHFKSDTDAWFDLDIQPDGSVLLQNREFVRHGDVSNWLTSEAFDLGSARSIEAETALADARELLVKDKPSASALKRVDRLLRNALPDIDPFWLRWSHFMESRAGGTRSD